MASQRVAHFGNSVFAEFSRLALEHKAVNLGQGFPDFDGPDSIKQAANEAIRDGVNQYAISTGAAALRKAVAAHAKRFYGQALDADAEVVVTSGATEAIFDTVMAFADPGDEVVLFEPYYDSYLASVQLAGATPRYVQLRAPDAAHAQWWFDEQELAAAFSSRTKLVFLNTPHNPTGKVFTREELELIGGLAKRHGAVLVADEVYEHLVFAPARHVRAATLPGFSDFTVTLSSGGKSFSFTGWKIGWAMGKRELVQAVQKAHQWVTFASASPLQAAIAKALELDDPYFAQFAKDYLQRRDFISAALTQGGFTPITPQGTYFTMARTDGLKRPAETDVDFCKRLVVEKGVVSIPPSVFYSPQHAPSVYGLARFAFCKSPGVLEEAARRLAR